MVDVSKFVNDFEATIYMINPRAEVEILGSASRGEWKSGSDIDLLIYSPSRFTVRQRKILYGKLWEISKRYGMDLGVAPLIHPPIIFVDSTLKKRFIQMFLSTPDWFAARRALKRIAPKASTVAAFLPLIP